MSAELAWGLLAYPAAGLPAYAVLRTAARELPVPRWLDMILSGLPWPWVAVVVLMWPVWCSALLWVAATEARDSWRTAQRDLAKGTCR